MKTRILPIIAGSFGLICVLQLTNLSLANARDKTEAIETKDKDAHSASSQVASGFENTPLVQDICVTETLAEALLAEQERIETRSVELLKREKALEALEAKLDKQLENIETTRDSVQAQLDKIETLATDDLKHLISMYETMKPKNAAEIFDSMAPAFAAGFLRDMNSARAGLIMSEMNAKKSYEISLVIANKNAELRQRQK